MRTYTVEYQPINLRKLSATLAVIGREDGPNKKYHDLAGSIAEVVAAYFKTPDDNVDEGVCLYCGDNTLRDDYYGTVHSARNGDGIVCDNCFEDGQPCECCESPDYDLTYLFTKHGVDLAQFGIN